MTETFINCKPNNFIFLEVTFKATVSVYVVNDKLSHSSTDVLAAREKLRMAYLQGSDFQFIRCHATNIHLEMEPNYMV